MSDTASELERKAAEALGLRWGVDSYSREQIRHEIEQALATSRDEARREQMESDCKAVCEYCQYYGQPNTYLTHEVDGLKGRLLKMCKAAAIRRRT